MIARAEDVSSLGQGESPLTKEDIALLFRALDRGTRKTWQRDPALREFLDLVQAVNEARRIASLAQQALDGRLDVYAHGKEWRFLAFDAGEDEATAV
jgi:hypothetical protein